MLRLTTRPAPSTLVNNVKVLDPRDGSLSDASDVLLENGCVKDIRPVGGFRWDDKLILAGNGGIALPGLIDCHLHMCGVYLTEQPGLRDLSMVPGQVLKNLRALADSGVTTARDMAGPLKLSLWLRGLARQGRIVSPRLLVPGPIITPPGGYPTFIEPLAPPVSWAVGQLKVCPKNEEEARGWVDRLAGQGVDFIKVAYTSMEYDDDRSPIPVMPDTVLKAITERAHKHGLGVAAHHIWARDLGPLLELPFDTLEHLSIDAVISASDVERIRQRELPVTTTLLAYGIVDFIDEMAHLLETDSGYRFEKTPRETLLRVVREIREKTFRIPFISRKVIETGMHYMLKNLSALKQAGVLVGAGTDSGGAITPCGEIVWELKSFLRAGLTPLEAVRAATSDAAKVIGRPELGVLEPGRPADLIVCRENPARDLAALEDIELVIRDGMIFKNTLSSADLSR
jgi:imidazolonepropionase-like amidohydrolase